MLSRKILALAAAIGLAVAPAPAAAQIESVDPDAAMQAGQGAPVDEGDYRGGDGGTTDPYPEYPPAADEPAPEVASGEEPGYVAPDTPGNEPAPSYADTGDELVAPTPGEPGTYQRDDLIAAGTGVFGEGAEGLARMIEDILEEQGEPNGYIVGREAGGAFILGVRYGSGTLHHRVEGEQPVYWTGPSIGFDFGGNAAQTFVLVYNLYDTDELFQRFPAIEGDAYFIGGLTASYLRSGDKVLIPIRLGAGLRLGANLGYMKFSREQDWVPF